MKKKPPNSIWLRRVKRKARNNMKSNLPARIEKDNQEPKSVWLIRLLLQYIVLRIIARYSEELVSRGGRFISHMFFSGKKKKKKSGR